MSERFIRLNGKIALQSICLKNALHYVMCVKECHGWIETAAMTRYNGENVEGTTFDVVGKEENVARIKRLLNNVMPKHKPELCVLNEELASEKEYGSAPPL